MTAELMIKTNRLANVALAMAICGLLLPPVVFSLHFYLLATTKDAREHGLLFIAPCFILPPILGLVSFVLALVARHRIKNAPRMPGKGVAKAAMIVGCVTLAFTAATWGLAILSLLQSLWGK